MDIVSRQVSTTVVDGYSKSTSFDNCGGWIQYVDKFRQLWWMDTVCRQVSTTVVDGYSMSTSFDNCGGWI
ncbi:hypothetical protein BgiBS90_026898 [Biomphalaria glabrata]|nr:hypothetical protein BgiBS90_026898 [Biomphalaria glabrata]